MPISEIIEFIVFGAIVGAYGAMVGVGGGFVIVPILLLFYVDPSTGQLISPQRAAGTSLAVVFVNAASATIAFIRQGRVDFQTGWRFAAATIPSAIIGAQVASYFSSNIFKALFGLLLFALAIFLNLKPESSKAQALLAEGASLPPGYVRRSIVDARGVRFDYAFNMRNGILLSFFIGFLSSILGIGGGVVHVPAMVFLFGFPAHLASATSTFVLVFTSLAGGASHLTKGNILFGPAAAMSAGVIVGAQLGAQLARRVKGGIIVRFLTLALIVVGGRLLYAAFFG
jgi:uncharacterized membrane protein YfcA